MLKKTWNVPLMVVETIKKIMEEKKLLQKTGLIYENWLIELSNLKLSNDDIYIHSLLDNILEQIKDPNIEYHILFLEGLITVTVEENEEMISLQERIKTAKETYDMSAYIEQYKEDINKKKSLFIECIKEASGIQYDEFITFKYNKPVTYMNLWNEFYKETRGVTTDLDNLELVITPYRKFYNLNEKPETSLERIKDLIQKAASMDIWNKEDGSMIGLSKYQGQIFTSTPGSLYSEQSIWAKEFFMKNYNHLVDNLNPRLTYLFEAIYPENRIVVDYQGKEMLVLTGIRNKETGELLAEEVFMKIAKSLGFPVPKKENKTLEQLMLEAKNKVLNPASKKEGWVIRLTTQDENVMFKLKCEQYVELHGLISNLVNPKKVVKYFKEDTLDDVMTNIPDEFKKPVQDIVEIIINHLVSLENKIKNAYNTIPKELLFTKEQINNYKEFTNFLENKFLEYVDPKISKRVLEDVKQGLTNKAFGKPSHFDKWTTKIIEELWVKVPSELKDQSTYYQKNGRLIGFIFSKIPNEVKGYVINLTRFEKIDLVGDLKHKDIDFSSIKNTLSKFEE